MNIQYYHKNIQSLTDATKEYIEERFATLEEICKIDGIHVEIDREKSQEFHMSVQLTSRAHTYYASASGDDVNACAEEIRGELRHQITQKKGRIRDLVRRGARSLKKRLTVSDDARL